MFIPVLGLVEQHCSAAHSSSPTLLKQPNLILNSTNSRIDSPRVTSRQPRVFANFFDAEFLRSVATCKIYGKPTINEIKSQDNFFVLLVFLFLFILP